MAAIVTIGSDGAVQESYVHFDQYANALNAVLGITDTAQDALGRLVLPRATSRPGSPSAGMIYYDTDLDEPFFYDAFSSLWRPFPVTKFKTADTAAPGILPVTDPELWIPSNPNQKWAYVLNCLTECTALNGLTAYVTGPLPTTVKANSVLMAHNAPAAAMQDATGGGEIVGQITIPYGGTEPMGGFVQFGLVEVGANAGAITLVFNKMLAVGGDVKILAGSWLSYGRVA